MSIAAPEITATPEDLEVAKRVRAILVHYIGSSCMESDQIIYGSDGNPLDRESKIYVFNLRNWQSVSTLALLLNPTQEKFRTKWTRELGESLFKDLTPEEKVKYAIDSKDNTACDAIEKHPEIFSAFFAGMKLQHLTTPFIAQMNAHPQLRYALLTQKEFLDSLPTEKDQSSEYFPTVLKWMGEEFMSLAVSAYKNPALTKIHEILGGTKHIDPSLRQSMTRKLAEMATVVFAGEKSFIGTPEDWETIKQALIQSTQFQSKGGCQKWVRERAIKEAGKTIFME